MGVFDQIQAPIPNNLRLRLAQKAQKVPPKAAGDLDENGYSEIFGRAKLSERW
jgi:hypothetical protein